MKQATVALFYDQRKGVNTVKLLVGFERKQRMYSTGFKVDTKTYDRLSTNAFRQSPDGKIKDPDFIQLWKALFAPENDKPGLAVFAQSIAARLGPNFTFEQFKDLLDTYGKVPEPIPNDLTDLINALNTKEASMVAEGRISSGANYGLVGKSLNRFVSSLTDEERKEHGLPAAPRRSKGRGELATPLLHFKHITPDFLKHYEEWMTDQQGRSITTVGIYCRHLRAVFNDAISNGIISRDQYPFGKRGYVIPAGKNPKKALSKADVMKIINYQPEEGMEQRARDFWVLSYLSNGMNFADILSLRWSNIDRQANKLSFLRQKTVRSTKGKQQRIRAEILPESWEIINRWANIDTRPTAYVFPFFEDTMDPRRKKIVSSQFIKMTNKYIRLIAQKLDIEGDVTTYAARHSFATVLLHSEAPLAMISALLGHANLATTESYLGSFDDERIKKHLQSLT